MEVVLNVLGVAIIVIISFFIMLLLAFVFFSACIDIKRKNRQIKDERNKNE